MDVLFTAGALALIVLALVLLGRSWPRSSRLGGYRAGRGAGHDGAGPSDDAGAGGPPAPEDDGVPWNWGGR